LFNLPERGILWGGGWTSWFYFWKFNQAQLWFVML
jgi:hypothetical protein